MPFVVHSVQVKESLLVEQHRRSLFGNGERARLVSNTSLSRCLHVLRNKIKKAAPTKLLVCYSNVYSNAFNSCLFFSGAKMNLSQELTVYTGQNLTLSCQPRDSPKHLVYWYKSVRNQKGHEEHFATGPSFTITKATVDDTAFYSCSAAEWGFWGIRHYIMVNVIGKLAIN